MKQNKPSEKTSKESSTRLVYSSDGSHLKLCKKCGEDPCICIDSPSNAVTIDPAKTILKIKLEKNQRGGKLVTVIHDFPFNPDYFEDLTKKLKNHCGTGGTYKKEVKPQIELQGDQREKAEALLLKLGFKTKRSGG
ncbi:MAG: stress response translation initiation inhibitor YciH [Bacteriovorax sp.]|nr:stress response translation initiation inhibitor YciH [Bacteriovorax sp.]